jgi:hypothetical protein
MTSLDNLKIRCQLCNVEHGRLFFVDNIFHFHRRLDSDLRNKAICKNCATILLEKGFIPKNLMPKDRELLPKFCRTTACSNCGGKGYDIKCDQFGAYREFDCGRCKGIGFVKYGESYGTKEAAICFIVGSAMIYEGIQINYLVMILGAVILLLGLGLYWTKDTVPPFG